MNDLILLHKDDVQFVDLSRKLDLLKDEFEIEFTSTEDFLYLGLYKKFNQVYVELNEVSSADVSLQFSYFNGSSWVSNNVADDTNGLIRSGFWYIEKKDDWQKTTIDSKEAFWIRISAADFTATFAGIDIVYADDHDLKVEFRDVLDYVAKNDNSLIAYHVAARNEIVNSMRVGGWSIPTDRLNKDFKQFNKWDFLNPQEIRQAATYLALSKLMFDVSQNNDDKFYIKYRDYLNKFGESFRLVYMSIDSNDNGEADDILGETEGRTFKV